MQEPFQVGPGDWIAQSILEKNIEDQPYENE
jgi:hypothetical protein